MYRVCAAGAFLFALVSFSSGCSSQVDSQAFEPGISPVQVERTQADKASSSLLKSLLTPLSPSSKWYADQD